MRIIRTFILALILAFALSHCTEDGDASTPSVLSGSYANILTLGERLYVLASGELHTFGLEDISSPQLLNSQEVNLSIESLFYNGENLFIGSSEGMYIYSIDENGIPQKQSVTRYEELVEFLPCDPIAANRQHAYVTLSTSVQASDACFRSVDINELLVYDISEVQTPQLVSRIGMQEPKGIGLDGDLLFVCQRYDGIKVFDISEPANLVELYHFGEFEAFDLIPTNGLLMVIGKDQIHQFDYSDKDNMYKLSSYDLKD